MIPRSSPRHSTAAGWTANALALLAVLWLTACGPSTHPSAHDSIEYDKGANWDHLQGVVLADYDSWRNGSDHACASPKLASSADQAVAAARATTEEFEFKDRYDTVDWVLDVAEGAARYGCRDAARPLFDFVLQNYPEPGFGSLRDRAQLGLAGLGPLKAGP